MTTIADRTATGRIRPKGRRSVSPAYLLLLPGALLVLTLVVIPLLLILRNSFAISDPLGGDTGGFTLENYRMLFDPVYAKTIGYSLGLALVNCVFCLVVGYLVAYYISTRSEKVQPVYLLLIIIPFLTDFLVRTFAWINLLGSGGPVVWVLETLGIHEGSLVPSGFAVTISLLYAFLPVAIFPIYASLRAVDPSLREAATDLGCGWFQTHRRIFVPLARPGIASATMLTFIPTLGVFVIPVLLGGGKDPLVGNLIVTLFTEFRNEPMGSALSMVVLALMALSGLLAMALMKASNRKKSS